MLVAAAYLPCLLKHAWAFVSILVSGSDLVDGKFPLGLLWFQDEHASICTAKFLIQPGLRPLAAIVAASRSCQLWLSCRAKYAMEALDHSSTLLCMLPLNMGSCSVVAAIQPSRYAIFINPDC